MCFEFYILNFPLYVLKTVIFILECTIETYSKFADAEKEKKKKKKKKKKKGAGSSLRKIFSTDAGQLLDRL